MNATINFLILISFLLCTSITSAEGQTITNTSMGSHCRGLRTVLHWRRLPAVENSDKQTMAKRLFFSAVHKQVENDLPGAIDDYLAALKLEDKDPAVHWYLGTAYQAAGQSDKAKQEFAIEQQMKKDRLTSTVYQGGYGNGTGTGFPMGNFGSEKLYIVPGRGITKGWNPY